MDGLTPSRGRRRINRDIPTGGGAAWVVAPGNTLEMTDEPAWWSANRIASAIRSREVSSRELLEYFADRIGRLDEPINSVVRWDLERATAAAAAADEAVAAGARLGPLHGVPMTLKDSFATVGCITTSGAPELADHVPDADAWPVARLRDAGAIPFAKTNLPMWADDLQTHNAVYGTTNNPHDLLRTPGGSSGGSGAALAMGFTPLELGSDIGGSIRCPSHYCGVVGHKSSFGIVPGHGQIPGLPGTLSVADIAVVGPMARSVDDLETALGVLAGPDRWSAPAWSLELPPSRAANLSDLRVAAWIDDDHCPVDADTNRVLTDLVEGHRGGRSDGRRRCSARVRPGTRRRHLPRPVVRSRVGGSPEGKGRAHGHQP